MDKYPKIQSIYKRDKKGKFIIDQYSCPEFEYLKDNLWLFTEKIDGTNIRVKWTHSDDHDSMIEFGGRTDNAQISSPLIKRLQELFPIEKFQDLYPVTSMILYGEGYGKGIQKAGELYKSDGVDFALFDIKINGFWLDRENMEDIANNLGINCVPLLIETFRIGYLRDAVMLCSNKYGFRSAFGNFKAEGIVLKLLVQLFDKHGNRIITKVKYKDFSDK